jgi:hypothetical protein
MATAITRGVSVGRGPFLYTMTSGKFLYSQEVLDSGWKSLSEAAQFGKVSHKTATEVLYYSFLSAFC